MRFVPLAEADKEAPALKFVPLGSDSQQPAAEPEAPSFPVGTMGGFEEAIVPIDRSSILDRPVPMPPAPPQDELLGINPQMVRAIKAQLDAAPPEKRQVMIAKLQNRGGVYGRIASSIASQYETIDRLPEKYRFIPKDLRSEVQAARFMAREGMTPEAAQSAAISQALIQAPLGLTQATPLTEAQAAGEEFKFEPGMAPIEETLLAIGRVGAKGGTAILQGTGGVIRFLGDAAGLDTSDTTKTLSSLNAFTQSMGEAKGKPLQIIEDAGTSIVQQLPALVGGAATGSQALVLGSMFINSFGQTYDDSRRRKLDIGDAAARGAMFAALEVIGEKFGLGDALKGIKAVGQGKPTAELAKYFASALKKEVPGELLTYAGQFAVDKGFGLNPEAGLEEFFKGAAHTIAVTLAQGGMMMGGGAAISKALRKINQIVGRSPEQSFDYEALAREKGFLAGQAFPPERPPAAPPVEPQAPAPIVTEAAPPVQPTARRVEEEEFETLPPTEVPEAPPEEPMAAQPVEPPAVAPVQPTQAASALPETPTVAPVIKPKTVEPPAPQHMDAEHPVVEIPVSDLKLSEEVPQFKYGANKKGVVQPLGGTFTKEGVAPIAVWQRLDGSLEVISGRHRFELAQRSGTKVIPSQIYYESQGFTAVDAAIKDAELNIRDEQGKVKDYVNYFKESGIDRDTAESKGFLARDKGKRGFTIANQGSDELIDALRADQVGDEAAYYIALNAPGDARLQSVGIKAIMDGKSMNVATNTMQAVKALASENDTTTDMFGFDDSAIKEAEAMARIASQKQREIQTRLSAISGAAKNPAVAKAEGIDIRNPEQVNRRIEELRAKKAAWDNWSTNPTLIAEIRAARGVEAPTLAPREEPVLTTQTKEELQEKERREREIEERKRQEELEAKRKEEADKEREGFVLTGSDREADEAAARGQEDMFAAPPAAEAPSPDATVEKYVNKLTKEGKELEAYETTEDNLYRTRTFEWSGDISRKDFDALTLKAEKSELKRGNKYSILLADTNVESSSLTFFVPSIQPTQQKISVRMQLQQTKLVEQPPAKKPPAPAPAPQAKTLPSFSKAVNELTPDEREAELRFIRSELSILTKKHIKAQDEQEEQELDKLINPLQERLNRLTTKGRLVEQKKKKEVGEATKVADEYETPMEVANGKTPDPALPPANRLILMPCSDMKGKTAAPAIDLYRGVFFQTLKTHAKDGKMPNVVILSAKHGIMNSNQIVEPYDQKMTPEQANILIASLDSQLRGLNIKNIDDVLIVGGKEYKKVMRLAVRKLLENGVINPEASINETTGELGEQRKQLREYMEAIQIAPVVEEKVEPVVEEKVVEEKKDYTPEQRKQAQVHADETGGEVVWQKGDYALIRGYSILSGDPVYVPTMGSSRARTDIENFTGKQISDDIKKEMIEAKKRLEKEAEIKHENKPFIVFDKGVSISKDISPELAGVIQGWKNLLKLDVDVYVSTIDDAKANRNNFTGPHRRIGSGTLDANERGSMRRMSDGSYYILFDKSTSTTRMLEVIAHEMGHLHQRLFYDRASPEEKQALQEAHLKWVEKQKGKSAKELVEALRARTTAQTTPMPVEQRADELSSYWTSFGEWYADQTSRWALSKEQPVGIVEKFFKRLGNQLRLFYQRLQNQKWLPDETFAQYIEKTVQKPIITQTQIQEGRDIDKASKMSSIDESAFDFGDEKVVKEIVKRSPLDSKALSKASELPGAVKKLPAGRSPELAAAAQQVLEGRMSKAEFDTLVNKYRPIHLFAAVPAPATDERVVFALSSDKKPYTNPEIDPGTEVGLRLDIPAFTRHNVMVVAIHEKRTPSSAGRSIGYTSAAVIRNVTFGLGNQKETLKIAAGKAKDALQTMEGKYVESTPSETYELAKEVFSNPQWIQIGFDPTRHSYFWDRRTTMPVVKADVVIQIGNFILAKNPNYATKEEFLFNIDSGQIDLFGGGKEDKKEVPVVKRGRVPELTEAAEQLSRGEITKEQFDAKVRQFSPVKAYAEPPQPATDQQVEGAVDASKQQYANVNIPTGTRVGVRLDIPAWEKRQTWVVSIHSPKPNITSPKASKVLSYRSVAKLKNVVFAVGDQKRSLRIAAGEFKDKLQTIEGEYVNITPEEAYRTAQKLINDPSYIQVGFNPLRHAYFYDRSTMQPVVRADEILQIGNFILAKNPTYGKSEDFVFDIIGSPTKIYKPGTEVRKATRLERIQILANLRAARTRLVKKVIAGEATIDTQRRLTELESLGKDIKQMLDMTKEPSTTPEAFLSRALKAYDDGDISADVLAVIQAAYIKQPELLNGLRLSVRKPGERETGAAGTFQTMARIVTLFKGTRGVEFPGTIRHELSHSLEQMMTAKQRKVVFDAWMKAFEKAIKTNTDQKAQAYFEAVIAYMDDPTEAKFKAAAKLLPSMDLYQFISPSEYWAVNAEPLMRQQLGSAWDRFKMAVRRLFEGLKAVFGFDNTYYVHKVFAQVMGGSKERLDRKSINASLISSSGISFDTLRDLDDVQDLIDKYNRPKTPMIDQTPVKTFLVKQKEASKEFIQEAVQDPAGAINTLFDGMNRQLLNARNKNVWYGTAINAADTLRYNNSLRTSNDLATSSLALDNAIRGGHISAEVVFLGGLEFNDNSLMYTAVKRDLGMVGVYKAEKEIKDRLGDQLGTDLIQGYLEAKRSRSIENEFIFRANELEEMTARLDIAREDLASARKRKDQELVEALEKEVLARNEDVKQARADLDAIEIARGKINMSEEEIDEFISMDVDHPELRDILKNFNAVNQNLLRVWREVGLLSQARYEALSNIKDYVPWNRIMSDEDDLHSPVQATTRSRANIAKEKLFKKGKPTVITSFTVKEGEQVYRIQPTSTLQVTLNGEVLSPELYDAEVNGKVTINVPLQDGDDLVFEGNREIENIIDNMTRSVMRMTMNAVSKYAANTIVREYATRDAEGKIRTYPKPEQERGRFYFIVNGRRVVVEIRDPLLAEAIFGMRNVDLAMIKPLQAAANMTRRFITTDPMFQLFQLFKDAPLAGLISGVKNPFIVYANVFASFAKALVSPTVVAATKKLPGGPIEVAETMRILRAAGIGGYYQQSRTAEAEVKRRIGIMNNNVLSWIGKALDHIGDASDYAQRMAIYDRIMSETGDEALALYQAANVLNFLRHGSGQIAQILVKTVPFANAYANSTDVLFQAMAGGGLKGRSRKASIALFFAYGSLLATTTLLYVMLVGDDEEYLKLDDQTKLRHYIIPGTDIKLPMNTSAAFFFKALPEALYNAYINAATKDETDAKRLRTALKEAAADMLLGPEPVPSALKPAIEIGLNRNFFTGRNVVPKNLEDVEAAEQYLGTTSEAGKFLSGLTGTDKTRLLNPIEADHIIRGLFGSVGAIVQWASNVLTDAAETKPTPEKKDLPMVGRLFLPDVARGHEEWFYNFKKDVDKVWNTYQLKVKREKYDEAEAYLEQNEETLKYHASVMMLSEQLQKINASIKYFETSVDKDLKPDERREEINEAKRLKQEVLEDIAKMRKDHELEVEEAEKERKKAK